MIRKLYNQTIEDIGIRILYLINTIDTYFLIAGILSLLLYGAGNYSLGLFLLITAAIIIVYKTADFYPVFIAASPIFLFFLFKSPLITLKGVGIILLLNLGMFTLIQFFLISIPESVVARDATIGFRKIWNSVFTIAPTIVSMPIAVYFSTLYALTLIAKPNPSNAAGLMFWITISAAALIARRFKPKFFRSPDSKPPIKQRIFEKVIFINIDGCRLDRFYEAKLPFLTSLENEGTYFPKGIQTIYRALTNPAFASIVTGTIPEIHGIRNNNLGQRIRVEGLPDLVKTKLYGSMHMKHFSKKNWDVKVVSLPAESVYRSDEIMFNWLKEDLLKGDGTRFFIADVSETDFLGHAYGSESRQYHDALKRADKRIGELFSWLREKNLLERTAVIISSDHGITQIDHAYLLFRAERYVPFIITGAGIRKGNPLNFDASIMDIAPTVSYLLGVRYPNKCHGRVFTEALEDAFHNSLFNNKLKKKDGEA